MKIKTLSQDTINKIAAGEVILRPASVVKELVENSLDSGADQIVVKILEGGKKEITISDNGCGIAYDEIPLAFKRHATSKINFLSDLENLETMGFRGEALSSVVAVADVKIITRAEEEELGSESEFKEGTLISRRVTPFEKGTEISVLNIFSDIPARFKFLKKDATEEKQIRDIVQKLALSHPTVSFEYISDGKRRFKTSGNGKLMDTARSIFGSSFTQHLHEFEIDNLPMKVYGLMGDLDARRSYRDNQIFYINGRFVKSLLLTKAFEEEWAGKLMKHQYPSGIIFVELPPKMLDVNVHPQKTEIRILNQSLITLLFKQSIREVLENIDLVPETIPETLEDYEKRLNEPIIEEKLPEEIIVEEQQSFSEPISQTLPIFDEIYPVEREIPSVQKQMIPEDDQNISKDYEANSIVEKIQDKVLDSEEDQEPFIEKIKRYHYELEEKNKGHKIDLTNLKFIGQVFNTYLILEDQNELYYIDQHAAHEATLYEAFSRAIRYEEKFESQGMLIPETISLTVEEAENFALVKDRLENFGFKAHYNGSELVISAVPMILDRVQPPELIIPLINYFSGTSANEPDFGLSKVITMSCKAAIKGGDSLTRDEIDKLLSSLSQLENPFTCPHGRPVIRKQSKNELERLFKRIV